MATRPALRGQGTELTPGALRRYNDRRTRVVGEGISDSGRVSEACLLLTAFTPCSHTPADNHMQETLVQSQLNDKHSKAMESELWG